MAYSSLNSITGPVRPPRRRKSPLPVVGLEEAGEVRIAPELRQRLRNRADRYAESQFNPLIRALQAQKRGIQQGLDRELGDIRNTVGMVDSNLEAQIAGLRDSGLRGRFLKDARSELEARQADLDQSIPTLSADAEASAATERADLRTDLIDARIDREKVAAQKLFELMNEARTDGEQMVNEDTGPDEGMQNALIAAREVLEQWQGNPELQAMNPLESQGDWRKFAIGLTDYEGVSLADAARALEQLRRRMRIQPSEMSGPLRAGYQTAIGARALGE